MSLRINTLTETANTLLEISWQIALKKSGFEIIVATTLMLLRPCSVPVTVLTSFCGWTYWSTTKALCKWKHHGPQRVSHGCLRLSRKSHPHILAPYLTFLKRQLNSAIKLKSTIKKEDKCRSKERALKGDAPQLCCFPQSLLKSIAWPQHLLNTDCRITITIYFCHQIFLQQLM